MFGCLVDFVLLDGVSLRLFFAAVAVVIFVSQFESTQSLMEGKSMMT